MTRSMILVLALSVFAVIGSMAAVGYTAINNANRVEDIGHVITDVQNSRYEATLLACDTRNKQNNAIISFVESFGGGSGISARAKKTFTITPSCADYAQARVFKNVSTSP